VIIVVFSLLGSLAVALVVPEAKLSLLAGTMQAFQDMLDAVGLGWLVKPVAILLVLGGIAHLSPWIVGPAKGLAAVARRGYLPPVLGRLSRNQIPVGGLVVQAIGGTVFSLLFLFLPNANTSYGILTAMTAQVIIVMYVLIFASVLKLRYSQPETDRSYRLPGGKPGVWLICGAGILGCLFAFVSGFFPPGDWSAWDTGEKVTYYAIVVGGFFALTAPPFLLRVVRRRGWPAADPETAQAE
jgi:amino acid transporter